MPGLQPSNECMPFKDQISWRSCLSGLWSNSRADNRIRKKILKEPK
jgi:hypothetical protein